MVSVSGASSNAQRPGACEVTQYRVSILVNENVRRFDVAMYYPQFVNVRYSLADLAEELQDVNRVLVRGLIPIAFNRSPRVMRKDQKWVCALWGVAGIYKPNDIRVIESFRKLDFVFETLSSARNINPVQKLGNELPFRWVLQILNKVGF
jgi:hypothetical protein